MSRETVCVVGSGAWGTALAGLLGRQLGGRWQRWAGLAGGLILIGLGIKILLGQILM